MAFGAILGFGAGKFCLSDGPGLGMFLGLVEGFVTRRKKQAKVLLIIWTMLNQVTLYLAT